MRHPNVQDELADLLERRERTRERLRRHYQQWAPRTRAILEEDGRVQPILLVQRDGYEDFICLTFEDRSEKWEQFARANWHLRDTDARGVLLVMDYWLEKEGREKPKEALIFTLRTHGWVEAYVHRYDRHEGEIRFDRRHEEIEPEPFTGRLITAFDAAA